ncbi:MAG: ATP-binding protein [Desulfobacterales bacterium]|jgi:signal transduction histidine kinase|nr:ATP-binding protein [Desulfobacterales bacterium]
MKFKIFSTLAGILFLAMLLLSLVMTFISHRFLTESEIAEAKTVTRAMAVLLTHRDTGPPPSLILENDEELVKLLVVDNLRAICILNKKLEKIYTYGNDPKLLERLLESGSRVIHEGFLQDSFQSPELLAPWKLPETIVEALPIMHEDIVIGGVAAAFSLSRSKHSMKKLQRLAFMYLLINTVFFSVIGFFRFDRFLYKPIQKLVKRASDYRIGDGTVIPYDSGGGEWEMLYRAVNRIVDLNALDNNALKDTVKSLQEALTDLKKAQQEIIRTEKLATVGRLSAGIAHEIGNPIGIVFGYLELLKMGTFSQKETVDIIRRTEVEIRRIDQIIRQLLDFSRPNKRDIVVVSVHEVIHEIVEMMRVQPLFSRIALQVHLAAEADRVAVDPNQLHQALLNLILNSADAIETMCTDRSGKLTIFSENTIESINQQALKTVLKISFSDNGEGISKENLENIFDPFYTTKGPGKGSGLGLWVSMMIIEGFRGKILVDSRIGKGTTMSVLLPVDSDCRGEGQMIEQG